MFYLEPWISYNTTAFGSNIVANDKVVVTNIINTKYNEIHSDGYNNNELAISYLYNNSGGMQQLTSTPMTILSIKIALLQGLNNIPANTLFLTNMNAMYCTSATGTTYYNYDATFYNNPTFILNTMLPSITTNLSQITKHAGVGEILTINGNNFGNTRGEFYFTSPRQGGIENGQTDFTTKINNYDILSWTNTQISVKVPSKIYYAPFPNNPQNAEQGAGSGPMKIKNSIGDSIISPGSLNIDYSIMNVGGSETTAPKRMHLARTACNADYVFTLHTSIRDHSNKTQIIASIQAAMNIWNMLLRTKIVIEKDASDSIVFTSQTASTTKNIIQLVSSLPEGRIMETKNISASIGANYYRTYGSYIKISNTPGSYSWHYPLTNPPANKVSFYNLFLHELGHIVCLQHVNDTSDLLYAISYPGTPK